MRKIGCSSRLLWFAGALLLAGCAHGIELGLVDEDAGGAGAGGSGGLGSTTGEGGASGASTVAGVGGAAGVGGGSGGTGGAGGSGMAGNAAGSGGSGGSGPGGGGGSSGGKGGGGGVPVDGGLGGRGGVGGAGGVRADASAGSGGVSGAGGAVVDAGCPTCSLKVQYECLQDGEMVQQIEFVTRIVNTSDAPVALSGVTMRYWYTEDATGAQQTRCDSDSATCQAVSLVVHAVNPARPTADAYVELSFTGGGMIAARAQAPEIRISILKTNPSPFGQRNDHSFTSTGAMFVDAPNVTAYVGGRLVWGTEPL
jgi:hypothetical protein